MSSSGSPKLFSLPNDRPALMGILNVTPDSFSDGGLHFGQGQAIEAALRMVEEGADLIDVGGESTRPGSDPVPVEEELRRTIPVVKELASRGISVSIDTMKPEVAAAALDAGAFLVNDVSGLRDKEMRRLVAERRAHVCIMHMQGVPRTMQVDPQYQDVVREVRDYLVEAAGSLSDTLPKEQIWIDPGIGFGKGLEHNLALLRHLDELVDTGYPVLVGVSRKSFIGKVLGGLAPEERLEGTLAAQTIAMMGGATVIRAHDVRAASRAIRMFAAIQNEG